MSDPTGPHCTICGVLTAAGDHARCDQRRPLEPPRFCAECARRMVVQVTPLRWSATCSRHGTITSSDH